MNRSLALLALAASMTCACSPFRFASTDGSSSPQAVAAPGSSSEDASSEDVLAHMAAWYRGNGIRVPNGQPILALKDSSGNGRDAVAVQDTSPLATHSYRAIRSSRQDCSRSDAPDPGGVDFYSSGLTITNFPDAFEIPRDPAPGAEKRVPWPEGEFYFAIAIRDGTTYTWSHRGLKGANIIKADVDWLNPVLGGARSSKRAHLIVAAGDGFGAVGAGRTGLPTAGTTSHLFASPIERPNEDVESPPTVLSFVVHRSGAVESFVNGAPVCAGSALRVKEGENQFGSLTGDYGQLSHCPVATLPAPDAAASDPAPILEAPRSIGGNLAPIESSGQGNQALGLDYVKKPYRQAALWNSGNVANRANLRLYEAIYFDTVPSLAARQGIEAYLIDKYRDAVRIESFEARPARRSALPERAADLKAKLGALDVIDEDPTAAMIRASANPNLPRCAGFGACGEPVSRCGGAGGGGAR